MDYPFENLGPERFQQFAQALIAQQFPDVQCFPVGQPDGGRDAIHYLSQVSASGAQAFVMYQVKFVRQPQKVEGPVDWLREKIQGEAPKVQAQVGRGVAKYVLMTNLPGTAHPGAGSIDRIQEVLAESISVPSVVWWRDDLARRLDSSWSLKWTYPELLTGSDFLRLLFEQGVGTKNGRNERALRAYLEEQYRRDRDIRFKQVELQNRLFDLFVDVPVVAPDQPVHEPFRGRTSRVQVLLSQEIAQGGPSRGNATPSLRVARTTRLNTRGSLVGAEDNVELGAASTFLHPLLQVHAPSVVLEGAPGQGKSTIVQYVCQVHRLRLIGADSEERKSLPESHANTPLRLPFKVDLRDLAYWIAGEDPFLEGPAENSEFTRGPRTLEAFLAAQVSSLSGGTAFTVDNLLEVLDVSAALLVLDGLDEVADIERRKRVVREIERGVSRLRVNAVSLQVIVTSRPAAFANSPGLPPEEFPHYQLGSIDKPLALQYARKWLTARQLTEPEKKSFSAILLGKLDEPHIKDLAKNPMQLTILLSLIHTRGESLPDKRTALYDNYVELFFNREAEKSAVVREHRDVLIDIHRFLAWSLHAESELGRHRGRIPQERLRALVRDYLSDEGHAPDLVDNLFTGLMERVVMIVSRVEGTYEFEVQPVREYFAARFLYETAPYSPTGAERSGTKPERFDALARNFYWLNVTRFFAGCYSKGELSSLIDGISELLEDREYRLSGHPRALAVTLLGDYVFSQSPRAVSRLLRLVLDGPGLRLLLSGGNPWRQAGEFLVLPKQCGQKMLVDQCFRLLETAPPQDYAQEALMFIRRSLDQGDVSDRWWELARQKTERDLVRWLRYGGMLGVVAAVGTERIEELISNLTGSLQGEARCVLLRYRYFDFFEKSEEGFACAMDLYLDGLVVPGYFQGGEALIEEFGKRLQPERYAMALERRSPVEVRAGWSRFFGLRDAEACKLGDLQGPQFGPAAECRKWLKVAEECSKLTEREWGTSLSPWNRIVESGRKCWGERWSWNILATFGAGIRSQSETCTNDRDLFDPSRPLCQRVRYARLRAGNPGWWKARLREASAPERMRLWSCSC